MHAMQNPRLVRLPAAPSYPANRGQGRAMARSYAAARSSSAGAGARSRLGSHGAEA
jgi:hypothetical protein